MIDGRKLLEEYKHGLGFKANDILKPRQGCNPMTYGVAEATVVVLGQCPLIPFKYNVIGENPKPRAPSDRHIRFEIDGYEWEKIGHV